MPVFVAQPGAARKSPRRCLRLASSGFPLPDAIHDPAGRVHRLPVRFGPWQLQCLASAPMADGVAMALLLSKPDPLEEVDPRALARRRARRASR